uniref:ATP synthase F0 subunit 8 n=1 Tax=Platynereis massiliensis TaxID=1623346 RepID=A0A7G8JTN2_9ANNE|nr:ATP synthase F0 subunit 8 [Platynereis massiliensis]QNJ33930.1 ATP synthase F0 subunit 8 [Platynereis massiliensis]
MPHLSPMNWILVPIFMFITLSLMMIIMWWQFLPQFPKTQLPDLNMSMSKTWKWW